MRASEVICLPAVSDILFKYKFRKPGDHRREGRKSWDRFEETMLVYDFLARHGLQHQSARLVYPLRDGWETANAGSCDE